MDEFGEVRDEFGRMSLDGWHQTPDGVWRGGREREGESPSHFTRGSDAYWEQGADDHVLEGEEWREDEEEEEEEGDEEEGEDDDEAEDNDLGPPPLKGQAVSNLTLPAALLSVEFWAGAYTRPLLSST